MTDKAKKVILVALGGPFIYWGANMLAAVFNWLFTIQAGRILTNEQFAVLSVFLSLQYLLSVPGAALATTVSRFTAYYSEKGEQQKYFYFFRQYWWLAWGLAITSLLFFLRFAGAIEAFFGIDTDFLMYVFAIFVVPFFLLMFESGTLSGQLAFSWVAVLIVVEAFVKFLFLSSYQSFDFHPLTIAVGALPVATLSAWVVSVLIGRSFHPLPTRAVASDKQIGETYKFLGNSLFAGLGVTLIYSLDVLLVTHYLSTGEAGTFAIVSLLGKILYFGAGSLLSLLIPITARAQAKNETGQKPFLILLSIIAFFGFSVWGAYVLFPEFIVNALLGAKGLVALPYLSQYALAMVFLVMTNVFSTYNLAKKNYFPSFLIIIAAIAEVVLIANFHSSIEQVVEIIFYTMFTLFVTVFIAEFLKFRPNSFTTNIKSLIELFSKNERSESDKKKVLIFNWRDLKHVQAGGAEVYVHEIAKRLVKKNFEVTLFTANDGSCNSTDKVDGVRIIRKGGFITVYLWAIIYYVLKFRRRFDIIIDSENGIPFFTPLFVTKPVVLVVHHVHQDVFFKSLIPPFSWIANFLETFLMPTVYKNSSIISVSKSTADELEDEVGLRTTEIISNGVDLSVYKQSKKSLTPQICYVGRVKKYKSVDVLIRSFAKLIGDGVNANLVIAGDGSELENLKKLSTDLGLDNYINFKGKVSEQEKIDILGSSWIMVHPSYQEGWGITCIEANACGTPVVASNVAGLRDSVSHGISGVLFTYGNEQQLYLAMKNIIQDEKHRTTISRSSRKWAENFSWDMQAFKFDSLLTKIVYLSRRVPLNRIERYLKKGVVLAK